MKVSNRLQTAETVVSNQSYAVESETKERMSFINSKLAIISSVDARAKPSILNCQIYAIRQAQREKSTANYTPMGVRN